MLYQLSVYSMLLKSSTLCTYYFNCDIEILFYWYSWLVRAVRYMTNIWVRTCQHQPFQTSSSIFPPSPSKWVQWLLNMTMALVTLFKCSDLEKVTVSQTCLLLDWTGILAYFKVNVWHWNLWYWLAWCCHLIAIITTTLLYHSLNMSLASVTVKISRKAFTHWQKKHFVTSKMLLICVSKRHGGYESNWYNCCKCALVVDDNKKKDIFLRRSTLYFFTLKPNILIYTACKQNKIVFWLSWKVRHSLSFEGNLSVTLKLQVVTCILGDVLWMYTNFEAHITANVSCILPIYSVN